MKKLFQIALVAVATIVMMASCKKSVDPIHGTEPVDPTFWNGGGVEIFYFPMEEFHELGQAGDTAGQRAMVDKFRKELTTNVVAHYPQISNEKNIHFVLGSGYAKDVKSGDGKTYSGKFENELIIIIDDPAVKERLFLACGNGMLSPLEFSSQSDFGTGDAWEQAKDGDSYAGFIGYGWGEMAKDADIGIRDKNGKKVSPREYLEKKGVYVSMIWPGDWVNKVTGECRDSLWREINFDSRQQETIKANAAKAAKAKAKAARKRKR